jgi:hypothetical protein
MQAPATAGEMLRGQVEEADQVALVRVEDCPAGAVVTRVAEAEVDRDAAFALEVPAGAAPTSRGADCSIGYRLRRIDRRGRLIDEPGDEVLVTAGPANAVSHEREPYGDRLISRFDARRFHIELTEAVVQGGGQVTGRIHANTGQAPGDLVVSCRCQEAWRLDGRSRIRNLTQPPLWHHVTLWEQCIDVAWPDDAHWTSFLFDLPERLPPAVEGRSIAFRYEIEARTRRRRLGLRERAAETPIGFDVVAR